MLEVIENSKRVQRHYKNIQGAFPGTFFGRKFTPFPHHEDKLKPLLIKIK